MKKTLLTLAAALVCGLSYGQEELIVNGGFENGVEEGWTPTQYAGAKNGTVSESTEAHTGVKAALLAGTSSNKRMASSDYKLKAGTYTYKAFVKAATADGAAVRLGYMTYKDSKTAYTYSLNRNGVNNADTITAEWAELSYEFTLDAPATINLIVMNSKNLGKDALIDDCSLTTVDGGIAEDTDEPDEPVVTPSEDYTAALTDAQGAWTFEDTTKPDEVSFVWSQSTSYGMKATAHIGDANYATESYLVSPAIVLAEGKSSVLTFDHAAKFGTPANYAADLTLWVRESDDPAWMEQLTVPVYPAGSDWTYVSSGDIDLSKYAGKSIQLGWRYTSTAESAATWELKNVKVTNAKAAVEGPVLKDATNTPETAYTVKEARAIIDARAEYDMSKEVYTKGIITSIKSIDVSQYERAQYWIADEMGGDSIEVYNGYYLEGKAFTANDQIKVGDEVIVYGSLTLYGKTYEINQNNYIYSINNTTDVISGVSAQKAEAVAYDLQGRRVLRPAKGLFIVGGKKVVR